MKKELAEISTILSYINIARTAHAETQSHYILTHLLKKRWTKINKIFFLKRKVEKIKRCLKRDKSVHHCQCKITYYRYAVSLSVLLVP